MVRGTQSRNRKGNRPPVALPDLARSQSTRPDAAELLYGRSDYIRVFISSEMRSGTLAAERLAAAAVVDEHPDSEAWLWERSADAGRYSSLELCVNAAKTSDVLILILGDDLTDVTKAEWDAARSIGANCALLTKANSTRTPRAEAFIAAQRVDSVDVEFSTIEDLRAAVARTLRRNSTSAARQRQLARQAHEAGRSPGTAQLLEAGIDRVTELVELGAVHDAAATLEQLEAHLGGTERPGALDLATGRVQGASGLISSAVAAYRRVIANQNADELEVAVACQNLGLELMRAGHLKDAARQMKAAYRRHRDIGNWFGVLQVTLNLGNLAMDRDDIETATELADLADSLREAFMVPLPHQRASAMALRANIAARSGRHADALSGYKAVRTIARRVADREGEIVATQNIGSAYHDLGRPGLARSWAIRALELAGPQGSSWRREEIYRLLALIEVESGNLTQARRHFEQARALAETMGDEWRAATLSADIGAVLIDLDEGAAEAELDTAYKHLVDVGDVDWTARVDMNRAVLAEKDGRADDAVAALERAADTTKASKLIRIRAHEALARVHLRASRPRDAAQRYRKALALLGKASTAGTIGGQYAHELQDAGAHKEALALFSTALRRAGDDAGIRFDVRSDRALLFAAAGRETEAITELEAALGDAKRIRDLTRQVRALHNIGILQRRVGNLTQSIRVLKRACLLAVRGDPAAHRAACGALAMSQLEAGRDDHAQETASTLLSAATSAHDRSGQSVALGVLAGVAFSRSEFETAAELYRTASRLNADEPRAHNEDLCGLMEAHAAADRWRPTIRAAQAAVTHAQANSLESATWPSLLRAARRFIDRRAFTHAAVLTFPAWGIASQVSSTRRRGRRNTAGSLTDSQFLDAVMTTAFHELWSGHAPTDELYEKVVEQFDLGSEDQGLRSAIKATRKAAAKVGADPA